MCWVAAAQLGAVLSAGSACEGCWRADAGAAVLLLISERVGLGSGGCRLSAVDCRLSAVRCPLSSVVAYISRHPHPNPNQRGSRLYSFFFSCDGDCAWEWCASGRVC